MFSLLLVIIYLAFISLGLPDSLIGAGWPAMHVQLGVPTAYAGIITMLISADTIISSLLSDRLTRRFGAGRVTAASVATTALALFGFSLSPSFIWLCVWAVPYGLGAGAVDAALNNYVALHYAGRQMNWLHCFWGLGAAISPNVMSFALTHQLGWQSGYRIIGIVQVALTVILVFSLPLWAHRSPTETQVPTTALRLPALLRLRGLPQALIAFLAYCALEGTAGIWAASYLVQARAVSVTTAARFAALFYIGITVGRFLSGIIADRLGDRRMLGLGTAIMLAGVALILLPLPVSFALVGLVVFGVGCAPIYPTIIHETPTNFGADRSQAVIGLQMAAAYVGSTFAPPLFGLLASVATIRLYPVYILAFTLLMGGVLLWQTRLLHLKAR
ncbi:MFS transporter [Lacticaseibacillus absianus]|uniref:MFS transporter n=1 Tax=Lacticaseibacillus absianus TaxID=2729623 RepID=UPI0015C77BAE|nr:MFS transporter [Lacticaseibacillus absianus]